MNTTENTTELTIETHERRAVVVDALNQSLDIFNFHYEETFDDVIANALKPLAEVMGVDRIAFYHLTEINDEPCLKQIYHWDVANGGLTDKNLYVLPDNTVVARGLESSMKDICLTKRLDKIPEDEVAFLNSFGIQSLLTIPVFTHGKFWGIVFFQDHNNLRDFDKDCMDLYRSAARLCVSSIIREEMARKAEEAVEAFKNRERMMEMLVKTATVFLSRSESLTDNMMTMGVGLIADMVNVNKFSVWRNSTMPDGLCASQIYRWERNTGTTPPLPSLQNVPYSRFALHMEEAFEQNESLNCRVSLLPEDSIMRQHGVKSAFITPIFTGSIPWGFAIFADSRSEHHFDDNSTDMMRSAAFLVANTVIRTEMEREIHDEYELNRVMFDSAPIGLTICDENFNFISCNQTALDMLGVTEEHYLVHFYDLSPEYQPDGSKSHDKARENFARALSGERMILEWMHCSPAGELVPTELTLTRAMYKGKYIALGYIYDLRNIKSMEADIKRLVSEVDYDALTGIYNRRYFDNNLKRVIKTLSRSGGMLSLLLIDIDNFKNFNDTYGHIEGDKCLSTVAEVLANSVKRDDDFVARYGGEEFVAVLPNTDEEGARMIAQKMHESIRKCKIPHADKSGGLDFVTISIGGTTGCVDRTQSGDDYVKRADDMLYVSKQSGRNKTTFGG